jgi:hypothetical protein|tara:strand:+ start:1514 stop:1762 length:249 start_codon:yes stop_codon:yes gene_type:complete
MEMLTIKNIVTGVTITLTTTFFIWTGSTLVEVDKRTAITEVKVKENNNMIKPLWEDFIRRNANGHVERLDEQTDYKVPIKWK